MSRTLKTARKAYADAQQTGVNNTVNSLPQFCPPITQCQISRLAGEPCALNGINMPMGPFEPVMCSKGHYCPKGGKEMIRCPAYSYCQAGASTPTPCAAGSRCPEGSSYQIFLVPLGVLIIVDALLILGLILFKLKGRMRGNARSHVEVMEKPAKTTISTLGRTLTGRRPAYNELRDDSDQEMAPMHGRITTVQDTWNGFQDAYTMAMASGRRVEDMSEALSPQLQAFIESMRKATDATRLGLSFTYSGLAFHPKSSAKPVLQNVTGSIERGSLVAVMGGSGAGKSTFVNVLMGKTANTGGAVAVNNSPGKIKRYKKLIGYVPQDDIVLPELTVRENILHAARIRLPRTWSAAEIEAHVDCVVDCLELAHVAHSRVGSIGKPVISGGQRKRVSIGMELAAAPMAIFLDEPTSGLDAASAVSIMKTLKALAHLGLSIIVIIHQPRLEIFEMLDGLVLLGNGQIIYEGPETAVQPYFEGLGFHFPEHGNLGDAVTDIITGNGRPYKARGDVTKDALIGHWQHARAQTGGVAALKRASVLAPGDAHAMHQAIKKRGASRFLQVWLCLCRAMLQQYRTLSAFWFEVGLASVAGLLIGLAENSRKGVLFKGFYYAPYEVFSAAADFRAAPELGLLLAIAMGLVSAAPGVRVFSEEMLLYRREAEAGHSRLAYFAAKTLSALPRMLLACFHFSCFVYLLAVPVIDWGTAFVANMAYTWCVYGLAACVSMVARREDAPLLATMISLIVAILSGAAPSLAQVKQWNVEWLWRASPGTWLVELYFGGVVSPFAYLYRVDMAKDVSGFSLDATWTNVLVLLGIGAAYRLIAFVGLFVGQRLRL